MRVNGRLVNSFDPRQFGRAKSHAMAGEQGPSAWVSDVRLFALTFAGGFLFVSLYLA